MGIYQRSVRFVKMVFFRAYNYINPIKIGFNYNLNAMTKKDNYSSGLTYDILTKLKDVCSDDIVDLRNRMLLQLGYESMRIRAEICQFSFKTCSIMLITDMHFY